MLKLKNEEMISEKYIFIYIMCIYIYNVYFINIKYIRKDMESSLKYFLNIIIY